MCWAKEFEFYPDYVREPKVWRWSVWGARKSKHINNTYETKGPRIFAKLKIRMPVPLKVLICVYSHKYNKFGQFQQLEWNERWKGNRLARRVTIGMGGRRKQEDERVVEKEEGPKGGHGRGERKQILDIPSRDTPWKNGLMPEFVLYLVTSCFCLLV